MKDEWKARIKLRNGARTIIKACEEYPEYKNEFLYGTHWNTVQFWARLYVPSKYEDEYRSEYGDA